MGDLFAEGQLTSTQFVRELAGLGVAPVVTSVACSGANAARAPRAGQAPRTPDINALTSVSRPNKHRNHGTPAET